MNITETYKTEIVPIEISYKGEKYTGEAKPLTASCSEGTCSELDITLNGEYLGTMHHTKAGWTLDRAPDQGFVDALGEEIFLWYDEYQGN